MAIVCEVGGGVALYLLAPKDARGGRGEKESEERAVYVVPSVGPDGGGIVIGGRL